MMKWSAYQAFSFSGRIFFSLFLSCLLACIQYKGLGKKKEIDKWGGRIT